MSNLFPNFSKKKSTVEKQLIKTGDLDKKNYKFTSGRKLQNYIIEDITTTPYDKVLSYLKDFKNIFKFMSNKYSNPNTVNSNNNNNNNFSPNRITNNLSFISNSKEQSFEDFKVQIERIDYIIDTIQSQTLYNYDSINVANLQEKEEDELNSLIGYLESYSSNNIRKNTKFQTVINNKKNLNEINIAHFHSFKEELNNNNNNNLSKDISSTNQPNLNFNINVLPPNNYNKDNSIVNSNLKLNTKSIISNYDNKSNLHSIKDKSNTNNIVKNNIDPVTSEYNTQNSNNNLFNFENSKRENSLDNDNAINNKQLDDDIISAYDNFNITNSDILTIMTKSNLNFNNKFTENETPLISKNFNIFNYSKEIGVNNLMSNIVKFAFENFDNMIKGYNNQSQQNLYSCKNTDNLNSKAANNIEVNNIKISSLIDLSKLTAFSVFVREKYLKNPYHNQIHGSDVFLTLYNIFVHGYIAYHAKFHTLDLISILLAGLVHDIGHPGFNNNFMVNSKSDLTMIYNDNHVLENFHCSEGYKAFTNESTNILGFLDGNTMKVFRRIFIECILSTDPSSHFKIVKIMKNKLNINEISEGNNVEKIISHSNDQQELLNFLISFADTSHSCKPFEVTFKWTSLLMEEFWHQGDVEKELNLPISFLCDRKDAYVGKGQIGFIQGVIQPGVKVLINISPELNYMMSNLEENMYKWEEYLKSIENK